MSTLKVNAVTDASGGNTATINSMTPTADSLQGFRNRIINGDMRIDQRNAGAAVTPTVDGQYGSCDRWSYFISQASKFSVQQSSTAPTGFFNSLLATSLSAYAVTGSDYFGVLQKIEGFNFADLLWGTANAKTITVSFWVRSSLTGTFGGAMTNSAYNRSYPFNYTINAANTWEQKTVTISGDTTGTWVGSTNGIGAVVQFSLGAVSGRLGTAGSWSGNWYIGSTGSTSVVGTNGATFYITGVQLEVGSVATPFERRPYGEMLMLCQRYYYRVIGTSKRVAAGYNNGTTTAIGLTYFPVTLRLSPTALEQSGTASDYLIAHGGGSTACSAVPVFNAGSSEFVGVTTFTVASGLTLGQGSQGVLGSSGNGYLAWSAEL